MGYFFVESGGKFPKDMYGKLAFAQNSQRYFEKNICRAGTHMAGVRNVHSSFERIILRRLVIVKRFFNHFSK